MDILGFTICGNELGIEIVMVKIVLNKNKNIFICIKYGTYFRSY